MVPPSKLKRQNSSSYIEEVREFYSNVSNKFHIFDPLDRDVCDEDGNVQSTKSEDILKLLDQMKFVGGQQLSIPMSEKSFFKLELMILKD